MINSFDAVVCLALAVAVLLGFRSGLLRSAATILGYLLAMPIAVWITSLIVPRIDNGAGMPPAQYSLVLVAAFVLGGVGLGSLLRMAVGEIAGERIGLADRFGGATFGAVRVGLVAIAMVLVFDALIPPAATPPFLAGSRLRPLLSTVGQQGLRSLPPEALAFIERLQQAQRF